MEIGADAVPFLARRTRLAGIQHFFDTGDVGFTCARAGEADGGRLERHPEFGQRLQLAEVDRRDDPVAAVALYQLFALEPHQCGADRGARSLKTALQPTLGQPLAGPEIEREDHLPELGMDLEHLRHGGPGLEIQFCGSIAYPELVSQTSLFRDTRGAIAGVMERRLRAPLS